MNNTVVPLIARILLCPLFLIAGYNKVMNVAGTTGYLAKVGVPMPEATVWLVIAIELLVALLVLLGWQARIAACIMALFTLGAAFFGHKFWIDPGQTTQFLKNLAIAGGFLLLAANGAGRASVDGK